jgi:hypothetical protein
MVEALKKQLSQVLPVSTLDVPAHISSAFRLLFIIIIYAANS